MLARELIMEDVRREIACNAPSRKSCLWGANSFEEAESWKMRLGGACRIARLNVSGTIHRADAAHLLSDSESLALTYERAHAYWRGEISAAPEVETLFSGLATVLEILN
jgi:Protein of unknown function (DUF2441)